MSRQVRFLLCHWREGAPLPLQGHILPCVGREDGLTDEEDHAGWVVLKQLADRVTSTSPGKGTVGKWRQDQEWG